MSRSCSPRVVPINNSRQPINRTINHTRWWFDNDRSFKQQQQQQQQQRQHPSPPSRLLIESGNSLAHRANTQPARPHPQRERDPHSHGETTTSPAGKSSKPVVAIGRHNSPSHRAPFSTRAHPGHHDQKKRRTHCAISHHKSVFLVQPTVRNGPPVTIKAKTYYGQTEILAFQDSIL